MPRRRRKPLRSRISYFVQVGPNVVQRIAPRVTVCGPADPILWTRRTEADQVANRLGGWTVRLTKYRRFRPLDDWLP